MRKRVLVVFLALMFVLTTNVYAKGKGEPPPKAESFNEMFSKGKAYGQFRTRWFARNFDKESTTDWDTFAVGGELHAQTAPWAGVSLGLGFYTIQDFGVNSDGGVYNHLMAKDASGNAEATTALGEYFINYNISKTNIKIGAQELVTAWLKKWDARLVPKTHEAIYIKSKEFKDWELSLGYAFREKDNVSEEFIPISQAFRGVSEDIDEGVAWGEVKYNGIKGLKTWLAYHYFQEIFSNAFLDAQYNYAFNDDVKWFAVLRGASQTGVGDELSVGEGFDTYFYGGRLGFEYHGATLTGHYSTMGDDNLAFLRGNTKIIQMQFYGNVKAEENAYEIELEYKLHKIIKQLRGMKIKFSYGYFDSPDAGEYNAAEDMKEFDVDLKYKLPGPLKQWDLRLRYAHVDGDFDNSLKDFDDFRLILNYTF